MKNKLLSFDERLKKIDLKLAVKAAENQDIYQQVAFIEDFLNNELQDNVSYLLLSAFIHKKEKLLTLTSNEINFLSLSFVFQQSNALQKAELFYHYLRTASSFNIKKALLFSSLLKWQKNSFLKDLDKKNKLNASYQKKMMQYLSVLHDALQIKNIFHTQRFRSLTSLAKHKSNKKQILADHIIAFLKVLAHDLIMNHNESLKNTLMTLNSLLTMINASSYFDFNLAFIRNNLHTIKSEIKTTQEVSCYLSALEKSKFPRAYVENFFLNWMERENIKFFPSSHMTGPTPLIKLFLKTAPFHDEVFEKILSHIRFWNKDEYLKTLELIENYLLHLEGRKFTLHETYLIKMDLRKRTIHSIQILVESKINTLTKLKKLIQIYEDYHNLPSIEELPLFLDELNLLLTTLTGVHLPKSLIDRILKLLNYFSDDHFRTTLIKKNLNLLTQI